MYFATFILRNVLRRPVRSALTAVGVTLAVGAVVSLLGIARDFERSFAELFEVRGVDLVVVRAGRTDRMSSNLDETIGPRIAGIAGVASVTPGLAEVVSFPEANLIGVPIQGWPLESPQFDDLSIQSGRPLREDDRHGVLLGLVLARNLELTAGDTIEIEMEPFRVVGVFESFNVLENGSAVMPLGRLQTLMDRTGQVSGFHVMLEAAAEQEALRDRVRTAIAALTDEQGRPLKLEALPTREYVDSVVQIRVARGMAWLTSSIALLIGTVGMLNTMIMSVFERTGEIGILRAIGWRRSRILAMILGESLLLCTAGAVAGAVGAVLLTRWLASFPAAAGFMVGTISPTVILQGFVIALLVGVLGGAYPAFRGAGLSPTEALRHE